MPFIGRMRQRAHGESRVWGVDPRPRAAPPADRRSSLAGGAAGRARDPGARHEHGRPRRLDRCRGPRRSCRPTTGSRPRSPAARIPRGGGRPGRRRHRPEVQARHRRPASRPLASGQMTSRSRPTSARDKTVAVGRHPAGRRRHRTTRPTPRWRRCATTSSRRRSARVDGVETDVTGMTAGSKDFNDSMTSHRRSCSRSCSALAFLLLLVTFRSIVVPIKAIVLNLLSVGAAYGVLVLVFQDGQGEGLLGFDSHRRHHLLAAAVPLRDPVRPVDGLPRVHPQPDPRGGRPRA